MCPACLTTLALIVTGTSSTGGLTALAMNKLCNSTGTTTIATQSPSRKKEGDKAMTKHKTGSRDEWLAAQGGVAMD
jgi:hypothetical protein